MFRQLTLLVFLISLPCLCAADEPIWHVDTFKAVNGTYSAWCGSFDITSCAPSDQDGGYGRNYREILEWRTTVTDPAAPCIVSVSALINIDTMWAYDYFYISCQTEDQPYVNLMHQDGLFTALPVSGYFVYHPQDYVGLNHDEVVVQFRVVSDGGWDGQDCLWPNDGAVQLDDIQITLSNGTGYTHDFEDGTLGEMTTPSDLSATPDVQRFAASNHPNPFNPATNIYYTLDQPGHLNIRVYDLAGRLVSILLDGPVASSGAVVWDGSGPGGGTVPSGIYFYEVRSGAEVQVGKMTLVK